VDTVVSQELFEEQLNEVRRSDLPSCLGWEFLEASYPRLRVRMKHPRGGNWEFSLDFSRFDDFPPSIALTGSDGRPILDAAQLPEGGPHFFRYQSAGSPRPSLCYEFAAEYYDWWHQGSINVWHSLRNRLEYRMLGILHQLYQLYRQTNG